ADKPRRAAVSVPERYPGPDRRRQGECLMSSTSQSVKPTTRRWAALQAWIDDRFPMTALWKEHASEYYAPKNFNFWYYFGALSLVVRVFQVVAVIFLTMTDKPSAAEALGSVEYIMRDVDWAWLIRYMHSTG